MKKFLITAIIALSAASASANRAKAVRMLEQRGYQVHEVDPDDHWGKPVLEIEAYKNGREYDIILSYPDLKIIRETIDY